MSAQKEKGPSQASQLVALARERYDLVTSEDGRPYGVRKHGPNLAMPLRGKAGLRSQMARLFTDINEGAVASQSALADAMTVLEGMAAATDPVPVMLRVAGDAHQVVVDLGTADGRCVVATPEGWSLRDRSPVLFRRSGAMAVMPEPVQVRSGEGLALLRDLVNMDDEAFHQLVAWLVAAWIPHIPHPVLTFKGEQGTGKSKAAQTIVNLVDPSPAAKRSQPRDVKAWATQAFNSWALCLDNISTIPPWLSDTLCKAVTGDGIVDRALYTDDDVVVLTFRRVLAMTTIDAGALAGDLAERLLVLDLQLIDENRRRTEEELDDAFSEARPAILAALFDLLSAVLRELPSVRLERMPRMADFARVLAAVDQINGWSTLASYTTSSAEVAADALEGDPFGSAVVSLVEADGSWAGTAGMLLEHLPNPDTVHPKWPKDATRAGGQLKRLAPILRSVGITFDDSKRTPDRHRQRLYTLTATPDTRDARITASAASTVSASRPDLGFPADASHPASVRTVSGQRPQAAFADAADAGPDAGSTSASATGTSSDLCEQTSPDAADTADAGKHAISGPHPLCTVCQGPLDPASGPEATTHPCC
ncbi:ATP-binding protein [Streptomyces sp. MB09-01]|uniref:ATP-binding protein n=1 Tax=Streptomyces sp. MB09-01 TaxID=3028666 RepID=UPI0029A8A29B|nr:ATP-binding protein [Streptomyces sp. MB09-01]MDX3536185.1 ATP-binding protein [Streptomyces sp. MB09-01]